VDDYISDMLGVDGTPVTLSHMEGNMGNILEGRN
jgi:hypothetical protein